MMCAREKKWGKFPHKMNGTKVFDATNDLNTKFCKYHPLEMEGEKVNPVWA